VVMSIVPRDIALTMHEQGLNTQHHV